MTQGKVGQSVKAWLRRVPHGLVGTKKLAIAAAAIIGVVSGLAAVLLKQGIGWLGSWRVQAASPPEMLWLLPIVGLVGGWLSGWLVERLAPEAAGSGIPQVKAALANVPIALNFRVAIVKLAAVVLAVGSGLNLGRQGPTVQVGAALAAQLSQWIPTSPTFRRQLIAAGAAAGLAAGFNAPIAGILFVVEEFLQDFSEFTLGTAILASFVGAVVSRLLGGQGLSLNLDLVRSVSSFSLLDVPCLAVLGLLAGLLGALFCKGIFASLTLYKRLALSLPWRIGLAGLISGGMAMLLPDAFRDNTGLQASLSMGDASWNLTLLVFVIKFGLTLVACGASAPGGLFAPSLILGAALGHLVGVTAQALETGLGLSLGLSLGDISISSPATYALAGMGAFFSAVSHGPITAIVIVFEITTDFNLVLPLMIGSVIAFWVSDRLTQGSLYSQLLAWNGIHLNSAPLSDAWATLTAADLMQRQVETLESTLSLGETIQAFSRSHHRGFPVVAAGKLVGIISQSDLATAAALPNSPDPKLVEFMTPQPITVAPTDPLTQVLFLLDRFKLSRLPVTEGSKLVGIITRADIIRAEADRASGKLPAPAAPAYSVYQTRSAAVGKGRLLLPLVNPHTAPVLLNLAAAIAQARDYELECLQVIPVSRRRSPDQTTVRTTLSRRMMRQAEQIGRKWQIPVHTQVLLAYDPAHAILEVQRDRHIDLVLMGWTGTATAPGRVFGSLVDTVVGQTSCEMVLVKLGQSPSFRHWLVPIGGGPNAKAALQLLPGLIQLGESPDVRLCQVFESLPAPEQTAALQHTRQQLSEQLACPVMARVVLNRSVSEAIIRVAWQEHCDVVMLGASRDKLLQQVIRGNIPETIARSGDRTVILVRDAASAS